MSGFEEPFAEQTDTELITACMVGDERGWQALIDRYRLLVFSIPVKWGFTPEDSADIFQAVWLDCFRQLDSLRDLERLRPWLIRVAIRKCHRFPVDLKPTAAVPLLEDKIGLPGKEQPLDQFIAQLEREETLRTALGRVTLRCRQIIESLFFEYPSPSYADIASRLDLSSDSIGSTRVTIQHICVFGKPSRGLSEKAFHASRRVNQGSRFTNLGKTLAFQNESW